MPLTEDVLQNFQSKRSKRESFINTKADSYTTYHTKLNKSFSVGDLLTGCGSMPGGEEGSSQLTRSWNLRPWECEDEATSNIRPISSHNRLYSRMYLAGPNKRKRYSPPSMLKQKLEESESRSYNNNNSGGIKAEFVYNESEQDDTELSYMDGNYEQNSESQLDTTVEGVGSEVNNEYDELEAEYEAGLRSENGCGQSGESGVEKTYYEKFKRLVERLIRNCGIVLN